MNRTDCTVEEVGCRIRENISKLKRLLDERELELNLKLGGTSGREVRLVWEDGDLVEGIKHIGEVELGEYEIPESSDAAVYESMSGKGDTTEEANRNNPTTTEEANTKNPTTTEEANTKKPTTTEEANTKKNTTTEEANTKKPTTTEEAKTNNPTTTEETNTNNPTTTQDEYITMQPAINQSLPPVPSPDPPEWKRSHSVPTILDEEPSYQIMSPVGASEEPDIDQDLYDYGATRLGDDDLYDVIDESRLEELREYAEYSRRVTAKLSGKKSAGKQKSAPLMDLPVVATCTSGKKLGQLNKPKGIALSSKGDIFVAEKGNNRVQVFSGAGNKLYSFGAGRMSEPYGVVVLGEFVYVTLSNQHALQMYSLGGEFLKQKGKGGREEGKLRHPTGIDGDDVRGKLFVCDTDNNRIQIFDNNLRFLKVLKPVKLDRPLEVKVAKFGTIVVLDRSPKCVHFINSTGELMKEIVDTERYPMVLNPLYIALTPDGNVLLSDFSKHCIHVFSEEGKPLWKIGQEGKGKPFEEPRGIACDGNGRLVTVCNKSKNMLQIFDI